MQCHINKSYVWNILSLTSVSSCTFIIILQLNNYFARLICETKHLKFTVVPYYPSRLNSTATLSLFRLYIVWTNLKWPTMISCVCYSDCLDGISANEIFVNINVPTCQALVRNLIFKFMVRLEKSTNVIIRGLACPSVSDVIYRSKLWTHWYRLLYVHFDNGWIQLLYNFC